MKRLIAATIALTLLGSTAAMAHGYRGHDRYYGYRDHDRHDNVGPAIAVGLGIAALAIIASQSDHDRYDGRAYYRGGDGYYYRGGGYYGRGYYNRGYDYDRRDYGRWYGDDDD